MDQREEIKLRWVKVDDIIAETLLLEAVSGSPRRREELRGRKEVSPMAAKLTLNKVRGWLYKTARLLGDVNAVIKGKIGRRILRRWAGKWTGRILGKVFG